MIRVLHVVNRMAYGGIETFIMNLYRNIDKNQIQFDFAVHSNAPGDFDDEIKKLGGNIYYFTSRGKNPIKYIIEWKKFLKENHLKYSAIHMHVSSLTTILPIVFAKKYGIRKRIVHAHSTSQPGYIHKFLSYINKKIIKSKSTDLLACSAEAGKFVFGNNKYIIISNGIDLTKYKYSEKKRKLIREQLKIKENEVAYVHVGRLSYPKNHKFLIDIFEKIKLKNKNSKLFLIGDGELRKDILDYIELKNLSDTIFMLGSRDDVYNILNGMDCFLFPSIYEGLPIAMIEAQISGLPVFSSDRVSSEAKISFNTYFISLDETSDKWTSIISDKLKSFSRKENLKNVQASKYDILSTVSEMTKIYIGD